MTLRPVSIAGVASTPFGAHTDMPIHELAVRAARAAIDEAGIDRGDIGSLYMGNFIGGMLTGQEVLAGLMADALGARQHSLHQGGGRLRVRRHRVPPRLPRRRQRRVRGGPRRRRGEDDPCLHRGHDRGAQCRHGPAVPTRRPGSPGLACSAWAFRLHAARYGTTREQVSSVVIKNKGNGLTNPLAQMGADLDAETIAELQAHRRSAAPVRLLPAQRRRGGGAGGGAGSRRQRRRHAGGRARQRADPRRARGSPGTRISPASMPP